MHRLIFCFLAMSILVCLGCSDSSDETPSPQWIVSSLWPRGMRPVPAPTSDVVLFLQEEAPAGLYYLSTGNVIQANPAGPEVRSDYAWSSDSRKFCFSSPGTSGSEEAGIYWAWIASATDHHKLWDRGSHPRFLPNDDVICAGPEDGSGDEGIWQFRFTEQDRVRLAEIGTDPEVSPDGLKIAYLIPGDGFGRILVVLDRITAARDTLPSSVLNYSWLGDSQHLIYQAVEDIEGHMLMYAVELGNTDAPQSLGTGIYPVGLGRGEEFIFVGLNGDRADGLFEAALGRESVRISAQGTLPAVATPNRIVVQDSTGLLLLTR